MDKKTVHSINDFISTVSGQDLNLVKVFLFGSYAKGAEVDDSDIDLALIIDHLKDIDKFDLQVELMLAASKFNSRIEPHPISVEDFHSNNPFAAEIKKYGIEIKFSDPDWWPADLSH